MAHCFTTLATTILADVRAAGDATVPTTIGAERVTNPSLRAQTVAAYATLWRGKDDFRG